jgi:hypothetical protein
MSSECQRDNEVALFQLNSAVDHSEAVPEGAE